MDGSVPEQSLSWGGGDVEVGGRVKALKKKTKKIGQRLGPHPTFLVPKASRLLPWLLPGPSEQTRRTLSMLCSPTQKPRPPTDRPPLCFQGEGPFPQDTVTSPRDK